jgi:uncharacterized protein YecE (DUF72 family)
MSEIWIGTSGWSYDSWRGPLYPSDLPKKDWLRFYASSFPSAEINGSFYRTPTLEAVRAWREQTPREFKFAWKASKFITHWKRLTAKCENSIALMETRLRLLGPKAAVVLFQLPPNFQKDAARLDAFLHMLPRRYRYAFEFRHRSWYDDDILEVLRAHETALCISDHADAPAPWETTAAHVYLRGHGPSGRYHGSYSSRTLQRWATRLMTWQGEGREVFVYFDNDQKAAAPTDARRFTAMIERKSASMPARTAACSAYSDSAESPGAISPGANT